MGESLNDLKIESEIKDLLLELQSRIGPEIVAIIYNPLREEGMKRQDSRFLKFLFENNRYNKPMLILSGHGGDFIPGIEFPYIIKSHVKRYGVFVPSTCGSALCYTILKSEELIVGRNTDITQIDPQFPWEDGNVYRAIKVIKDDTITDADLKKTARDILHMAEHHLKELCSQPCIFKYKNFAPQEFQHIDYLTAVFMNKEDHEKKITSKELLALEANLVPINESIDQLANDFLKKCQDFTIKKNVRVTFVSTIPIRLEGESEGSFICPLY